MSVNYHEVEQRSPEWFALKAGVISGTRLNGVFKSNNLPLVDELISEMLTGKIEEIFVNFAMYCDITYVPNNIYHRIPFVEIDEIYYVHPSFTTIDMYRIMSEPFFSNFRWEKNFFIPSSPKRVKTFR